MRALQTTPLIFVSLALYAGAFATSSAGPPKHRAHRHHHARSKSHKKSQTTKSNTITVTVVTAPPSGQEPVLLRQTDPTQAPGTSLPQGKGKGKSLAAGDQTRNRQKNRPWKDPSALSPHVYDSASFLTAMQQVDQQLPSTGGRAKLSVAQKKLVSDTEAHIVSLEGYAEYVYAGGSESCNSDSAFFHDWHMEIMPSPIDHVYRVGDPTPIICEITPLTERANFDAGVDLGKLFAYSRWDKAKVMMSNGHPAHKVRITGFILWDDSHLSGNQVGDKAGPGGLSSHTPWRITAWEIHPVLKIEDLGP